MKFEEALACYRVGRKIRRKSWDTGTFLSKNASYTSVEEFTMGALIDDEWEVMPESNPTLVKASLYASDQGAMHFVVKDSEDDIHYSNHKLYKKVKLEI